jgi:hypothetical protein
VREYARDLNVLTLCIWSLYDPDGLLGGEISMRSNLLLDVMMMGDVDDIRLERRIEHHRNRLRKLFVSVVCIPLLYAFQLNARIEEDRQITGRDTVKH